MGPLDASLECLRSTLATAPSVRVGGRVSAGDDTLLHGHLPAPRLGEVVRVQTTAGPVLAEVLAFDGNRVRLALLEAPVGPAPVGPGDVVARSRPSGLAVRFGPGLLGRVLDALGRPMDGAGPVQGPLWTRSVAGQAPNPLRRSRLDALFRTGIPSLDVLNPLVRGGRFAIVAPAGTGKTSLLAALARSPDAEVVVLALVGERGREVRDLIEGGLGETVLSRTVVVCAPADAPPLARVRCVEVATTLAEGFRDLRRSVLLLVDSLTRYARALRDLSLAAGEPQGRRGYPGSVAARLAPLLERAGTASRGAVTGIYALLVEDRTDDDPLFEEVRSLTDGHIVLSPSLARRGIFPAVDPVASLSRLAGRVVSPSRRALAARFRHLWATLAAREDLVAAGAYVPGSDPDLDEAIRLRPALEGFLARAPGPGGVAEAEGELARWLGGES